MERSAMEGIADRLASIDGLYFPRSIQSEAPDPSRRKSALLDLLSRDASLFLERYGSELTSAELREFEILRWDYEVEWHLTRLRRWRDPTVEGARRRELTVKNRRRAYMEGLVRRGEYFSEDAMREREPYLHHEYLGRFQDPSGRVMSRPGERLSETLMRLCEEAMLVEKIRGEQQRLGVARRDWVGNDQMEEEEEVEEEEEEEEEEEKDGSGSAKENADQESSHTVQATDTYRQLLSVEEMQDQLEQFTQIMQQKFLAGEDSEHLDYCKIDNDERLDDHWLKEASQDAEEKYFDED